MVVHLQFTIKTNNMEFKGTQGEWKAINLEATDFYNERNEIHFGNDGECIAEVVHNDYDAQLIAAAPELLKLLIEMHQNSNAKTPLERDRFYKVEKAIKKALGL
jgi:hypothetical protein